MIVVSILFADLLIFTSGAIALVYGICQWYIISRIRLLSHGYNRVESFGEGIPLVNLTPGDQEDTSKLLSFHDYIQDGAKEYFQSSYGLCFSFTLFFALILFTLMAWSHGNSASAVLSTTSYLIGSILGAMVGVIGVMISIFTGVRTTISAQEGEGLGYIKSFMTAFRGGAAFSFIISGISLILLFGTLEIYRITLANYGESYSTILIEYAGIALGVSIVALFVRIGGGIFSNAMDIGANLIGKVIYDIQDNDPRNPAIVGDLVGDNIGNVAGISTDMMGSWMETLCSSLYIASQVSDLVNAGWVTICFPFFILSSGIIVSFIASALANLIDPIQRPRDVELTLRLQLVVTTILLIPFVLVSTFLIMPNTFTFKGSCNTRQITTAQVSLCLILGLFGALIYGLITEYFTSNKYGPVQKLALSAAKGASSEIMHGVSVGYSSVLPGSIVQAIILYIVFQTADVFGIALAALGVVALLPSYLIIGALSAIALFGPICDNATGIAGLVGLEKGIVEKTIALDNAGSALSAIGKGYSTSCAFFSSVAMFSALTLRVAPTELNQMPTHIEHLGPLIACFVLIGASIPYWLSSITLTSVNKSIEDVVKSVSNQLNQSTEFCNQISQFKPNYVTPIRLAIDTSIQELLPPAAVGILTPIVIGVLFGLGGLLPFLVGFIISAVHMGAAMSNTGCAWNSAKRVISVTESGKGMTDLYKATVIGDTIGDPMKDTSGPALNILMKLMVTSSFVFLPFYMAINDGRGLLDIQNK